VDFPTFGLSVVPPPPGAGWTRAAEAGPAEAGRWVRIDPKTGRLLAVVTAEVAPLRNKGLEQIAASLARASNGVVLPDRAARLDGAPALRIGTTRPDPDAARDPHRLYRAGAAVAAHGNYAYLVGGRAVAAELPATARAVEAMRQSWRWAEVEAPADYVSELRDEPSAAAGKRFAMNLPAVMRPAPVRDRDAQSRWSCFHLGRGETDFAVAAELVPAAGLDSDRGRMEFGRKLIERIGGPGLSPVRWNGVPNRPGVWLSTTLHVPPGRLAPGAPTTSYRFAVVPLDPRNAGLVLFAMTPADDDPTARAAYELASAAIAATIRRNDGW
jgi:hypothetical protein